MSRKNTIYLLIELFGLRLCVQAWSALSACSAEIVGNP